MKIKLQAYHKVLECKVDVDNFDALMRAIARFIMENYSEAMVDELLRNVMPAASDVPPTYDQDQATTTDHSPTTTYLPPTTLPTGVHQAGTA